MTDTDRAIRWVAEASLALDEAARLLLALACPTIPDRSDEQAAVALVDRITTLRRAKP